MDVFAQIPMGLFDGYLFIEIGLIMIILPFAFAYFLEMQKELMKIQGSNSSSMQWTDAQPCFEANCSIELIISSHYHRLFHAGFRKTSFEGFGGVWATLNLIRRLISTIG